MLTPLLKQGQHGARIACMQLQEKLEAVLVKMEQRFEKDTMTCFGFCRVQQPQLQNITSFSCLEVLEKELQTIKAGQVSAWQRPSAVAHGSGCGVQAHASSIFGRVEKTCFELFALRSAICTIPSSFTTTMPISWQTTRPRAGKASLGL